MVSALAIYRKEPGEGAGPAGVERVRENEEQLNRKEATQLSFITSTGSLTDAKSNLISQRIIRSQAKRYSLNQTTGISSKTGPFASSADVNKTPQNFDRRKYTSRFKLSTWSRKPSNRTGSTGKEDKII